MSADAAHWIEALGLAPHPEGGFYRETWRSAERLAASALPSRFGGERAPGTAIYYLLRAGESSRLHRLHADEIWHLYAGGPLDLHVLLPDGRYERHALGLDLAAGERPQQLVPHGCWFGAEVAASGRYALVGCTTAPGFDFADFELAGRAAVLASHPSQRALIERLTEPQGVRP